MGERQRACACARLGNAVHLKSFVALVARETSGNLERENKAPKIRLYSHTKTLVPLEDD